MNRIIILVLLFFLIYSCNNKTTYSGKIISQDSLENLNYENKENLIKSLGNPSYIDPINQKFIYYSKKEKKTSIFNKVNHYNYIFVFEFDNQDNIINSKVYNLDNLNEINMIDEVTDHKVVKRGLIEKIFGGVGTQQEFPNSP